MVLPGTFMPFFFPLGIAFMGSQSAVMMKMAGEQWQYGKRRISAMSNEDFNKMTPLKLFEIETNELKAMIPLMEKSMKDMSTLTPMIVKEMVDLVKVFIETAPSYILKLLGIDVEGIISGKTPGELEYEEWLAGGKEGPEPDIETFPTITDTPPSKDELFKKELAKKKKVKETLEKYSKITFDQSIVGSGLSRTDIQKAIKAYDSALKTLYGQAKLHKTPAGGFDSHSLKNIQNLIKTYINAQKQFKIAMAWSNLNYPKLTP